MTLHLPRMQREVKVDYLGASLIAGGVSALLIWVTFAGNTFPWISQQTAIYVVVGVALLTLALIVELRAPEPIIPMRIVKQRTPVLAILGSLAVGIALFGASVFLGQYFQISRGYSPTAAGLLAVPMMFGFVISSTVSGRYISKHGRFKRIMVVGAVMLAVGFAALGTMDHQTSLVFIGVALFVAGLGMGMSMQNLVLAVQNTVDIHDVGASTSTVTFFRSLGGTIGVALMGAMLNTQLQDKVHAGLAAMGIAVPAKGGSASLDLKDMPAPIAHLVRVSFGDVTGHVFIACSVLAFLGIFAIAGIREVPLRTSIAKPKPDEEPTDTGIIVEL